MARRRAFFIRIDPNTEVNMGRTLIRLLMGLGAGAALMYFMDPERGRRRRALARDKAIGLSNDARERLSGAAQDISNRATGMIHEARKAMTGSSSASDEMPVNDIDQ
jgi:hypothetical protein